LVWLFYAAHPDVMNINWLVMLGMIDQDLFTFLSRRLFNRLSYLEIIVCDRQITARSNSIAFRTAIKKVAVFMSGTVTTISGHMSSYCSW
jgi:hypothetical protein